MSEPDPAPNSGRHPFADYGLPPSYYAVVQPGCLPTYMGKLQLVWSTVVDVFVKDGLLVYYMLSGTVPPVKFKVEFIAKNSRAMRFDTDEESGTITMSIEYPVDENGLGNFHAFVNEPKIFLDQPPSYLVATASSPDGVIATVKLAVWVNLDEQT